MIQDDRDRYRQMRDDELLTVAREEGVTAEMGVALAERLAAKGSMWGRVGNQGNFQPRSVKA